MSKSDLVTVVKYPDRDHFMLRWKDPVTGKLRSKTAGTSLRREAERAAVRLEKEISEGKHGPAARMSWQEFREYHERHCLSAMKPRSFKAYLVALNAYERFHKPVRLADISAACVTSWQTELRIEGKSEATIACYTRHLRAVLNWAQTQGLLNVVPMITMPKRVRGTKAMKGRPITTEEFERMLVAVPCVVGVEAAASWRHYLQGLWVSGLRLTESLLLEWTNRKPGALVVDFSGRHPMLRIPAESDKGGQDRLLPIAPEFANFLQATPVKERHGRVFKLVGRRRDNARMLADWVSRVVCRIGREARIVVDERERRLVSDARAGKARSKSKARKRHKSEIEDGGVKRKYASSHDLRRAFGLRWSTRVMPIVLQQLMRHESIETTLRYYVGRDADMVADTLWKAVESANRDAESNKTGNIASALPKKSTEGMSQPIAQ